MFRKLATLFLRVLDTDLRYSHLQPVMPDGEEFNPEIHLTRADLRFVTGADGQEYAVIMMRPAKGKPGARKTVLGRRPLIP